MHAQFWRIFFLHIEIIKRLFLLGLNIFIYIFREFVKEITVPIKYIYIYVEEEEMGGKFYGDLLVQNFIESLIRMILILFSSFRGLILFLTFRGLYISFSL